MYLTQKTFNKPSLPPLSSLLKDQNYKLPSIETFYHNSNASMSNDSVVSPTSRVSKPATPLTASATPISMQHPINHPILPLSNAPTVSSINQPEIETATEKKTPEKKRKTDKSFAFISHSVQTFPSQEPSIDNAPLARRKRRRTSPNELNILNQEFILGSTPNKLRRIEIANKVSMTEKAVQIWFQNKRQSIRKQSSNQSEITELPPTNDSSLVNSPNNSSINLSMINSMNNSVNNSMVNNTANSSMISSTPIKPVLSKSQSFSSPDNLLKTLSPIKPRSSSTSIIFSKPFVPPSAPQQTPSAISSSTPNVTVNQSTPNTSTIEDDSLVLNETKKKQPLSLNNLNSSTMTFKLSKFKPNNDNKENFPLKKSTKKNNKIQNLLNNVVNDENERKPLLELNNNKKVNEGVQNLLSLREGHWR